VRTYKRRLSFSQLVKKGENDLFKYLPPIKEFFLAGSVRGGLEGIIDILTTDSKVKVLLPVFIAEGVIRPFRNKKIGIVYYKLNEDLAPDISDIERQISGNHRIKFMVVVHYFGFAYDFTRIRHICSDNKIYLLEDCVHALFSKNRNEEYLGMTGDISFFSFPKILPVPDGAGFFINNPELIKIKSELIFSKGISCFIIKNLHLIYLLVKILEVKLPYSLLYQLMNSYSKIIYGLYYNLLNHIRGPQRISNLTLKILKNINYDELISKRKAHIKVIYESLRESKKIIFFRNYEPYLVLTGVPVLSEYSSHIILILKKNNIECLTYRKKWLFISPDKYSDFKVETDFYNKHFLFPVHEDDLNYSQELQSLLDKEVL
jgi:dTDP-4-amino-4,6-dideoxygalactose transaminase